MPIKKSMRLETELEPANMSAARMWQAVRSRPPKRMAFLAPTFSVTMEGTIPVKKEAFTAKENC